jgi:hypothetical protein
VNFTALVSRLFTTRSSAPVMLVIGVCSSWLTTPTNSSLLWATSSVAAWSQFRGLNFLSFAELATTCWLPASTPSTSRRSAVPLRINHRACALPDSPRKALAMRHRSNHFSTKRDWVEYFCEVTLEGTKVTVTNGQFDRGVNTERPVFADRFETVALARAAYDAHLAAAPALGRTRRTRAPSRGPRASRRPQRRARACAEGG